MTYAQRTEITHLWQTRYFSTHEIAALLRLTEAEVYNVIVAYDHAHAEGKTDER